MNGTKALFLEDYAKLNGISYLRFDYSGHGKSSGRFIDGTISSWYKDALEIITKVTVGPQILVGSSMGGWISLLIAKSMPNKVSGLVTIAGAPDFTEDSLWKNFSHSEKLQLESGVVLVPSDYGNPYSITKNLIDDGRLNLVLREKLMFQFPVRIIQGTADASVDIDTANRLFNNVISPDLELIFLKDEDHRFSSIKALKLIERTLKNL
jgi:esterase/lipase